METDNEMTKYLIVCPKCDRTVENWDNQCISTGNIIIYSSTYDLRITCLCGKKFGGFAPSDRNLEKRLSTKQQNRIAKRQLDALAEDDLPILSKAQIDKKKR